MSKSPYTAEFKLSLVEEYLKGSSSCKAIAENNNVSKAQLGLWISKYRQHGIECFMPRPKNNNYSKEFKLICVREVLDGLASVNEVVVKYNISSRSVLQDWIKQYNNHIELKDYVPKQEVYMAAARRKTSLTERKEIVEYCLSHDRNYKETAALFNVSYSQVYDWVKKYNAKGDEGLKDRRGKHKQDEEVDEMELMRRKIARLERQLAEEQMRVLLLKKVQFFEGK